LGRATHGFGTLVDSVRIGLGRGGGATLMAAGLLIVGAISGFMCSYLITIMKAPELFRRAALAGAQELVQKAQDTLSQAQDARDAATHALAGTQELVQKAQDAATQAQVVANDSVAGQLVHRQLDVASQECDDSDLVKALQAASPDERTRLGQMAAVQRRFTRRDPDQQADHDRTIKVFKALTEVEPNNWVSHSELGYALGEAAEPQLQESVDELDKAISLRGSAKQDTDFFAELARANASIKLYGENMTEDERQRVASDLRTATEGNQDIAGIVETEPELRAVFDTLAPQTQTAPPQDSSPPVNPTPGGPAPT
jgi:hypothetical protein